ncbi:MAG TPA: hypothetical protein PK157_20325 [Bryobacteraceae bacterium]|nr:hypothetical protein [Bryobacteraceae bacterium]
MSDGEYQREIERCRREIAEIENLLRSGHPDVEGLCLALADWSGEKRLLEDEKSRRAQDPAAVGRGAEGVHLRRP